MSLLFFSFLSIHVLLMLSSLVISLFFFFLLLLDLASQLLSVSLLFSCDFGFSKSFIHSFNKHFINTHACTLYSTGEAKVNKRDYSH